MLLGTLAQRQRAFAVGIPDVQAFGAAPNLRLLDARLGATAPTFEGLLFLNLYGPQQAFPLGLGLHVRWHDNKEHVSGLGFKVLRPKDRDVSGCGGYRRIRQAPIFGSLAGCPLVKRAAQACGILGRSDVVLVATARCIRDRSKKSLARELWNDTAKKHAHPPKYIYIYIYIHTHTHT